MVGRPHPDVVRLGSRALARAETLAQIQGRTVAVVEGSPPQTLIGAEPPAPPPAALAPRVDRFFRSGAEPWQVAGALGLGAFVVAVALLLAARLRRRGVRERGA